jgi:hypothetical protein
MDSPMQLCPAIMRAFVHRKYILIVRKWNHCHHFLLKLFKGPSINATARCSTEPVVFTRAWRLSECGPFKYAGQEPACLPYTLTLARLVATVCCRVSGVSLTHRKVFRSCVVAMFYRRRILVKVCREDMQMESRDIGPFIPNLSSRWRW